MDTPRMARRSATRPGERVISPIGELTAQTAPAFRTSITHVLLEGTRGSSWTCPRRAGSTAPAGTRSSAARVRYVRGDATLILRAAPDHVRELFRLSDAGSDVQERLELELTVQTDEVAMQRDRLEADLDRVICGSFIERTTTGHPLVCVLPLGHTGAHQWR
jgi:hypothetical protein